MSKGYYVRQPMNVRLGLYELYTNNMIILVEVVGHKFVHSSFLHPWRPKVASFIDEEAEDEGVLQDRKIDDRK